jgi:transcriptional regulator with XRE-family HTH domain
MRKHRGFTQTSLALASGVRQETISQIETCRVRDPQYSTVEALAHALGVTTEAVAKAIGKTKAA